MPKYTGRGPKFALIVGYLALLVGVFAARAAPATGYELSIYAATPIGYWIGAGTALLVGIVVSTVGWGRLRSAGMLLAVTAAVTVAGLPVLRGYHYYGAGDSLSHLGWAREIASGTLSPFDLLYPGLHTMSVLLGAATGVSIRRSMLYVVLFVFIATFVLFVPLTVNLLDGTSHGTTLGLLAALLVLPINNISVHPNAHPTSQAILFSAFILFLVLAYVLQTPKGADGGSRFTPVGVLLALALAAVLFIHPQQALNVLILLVGISAFQFLARRVWPTHPVSLLRPLYGQTAFLLAIFLLWTPRHPRATGATTAIIMGILEAGPSAGEVVGSKSGSVAAIGGSIVELFVKLFFPSLVFSILAGAAILAVLAGVLGSERRSAPLTYLVVALVPLFFAFVVFFISAGGDQYFRYLGFIMLPVTILGTVALAAGVARLDGSDRPRAASFAILAVFLLLVPMSIVAFHPSPYMYQPSKQVPENNVDGYAAAFEHRDPDVEWLGLRGGPRRFVDAAYGTQNARFRLDFPGYRDGLQEPVFNNATYMERYDEDRYLAITRRNYVQETELYQGFRYTPQGFRALEMTPGVGRIRVNDGFRLYLVNGGSE